MAGLASSPVFAAPPQYDHVVIVIEENHSQTDIIGNLVDAPFINSLAAGGLLFTNCYAITHPSQPNYLEFFSGSNQGVFTNAVPLAFPFSTANLGAALRANGFTFIGYSELLPAAGDATTADAFPYARRHNPWANWQDAALPTPANRLPPSTNLPFSAFPSDFTALPHVSFVVPGNLNNMHDGTILEADTWLSNVLGAYAVWAKTHNSLLIISWDEDSFASGNHIPLIFSGAGVRTGVNTATWTLHNVLRTIEDMYGVNHSGSAAQVRPIADAFIGDLPAACVTFQQGVGGYSGTRDTAIRADNPGASYGGISTIQTAGGVQSLLRFENLIGNQPGQIPPGAQVLSAKVLLTTTLAIPDPVELHRMLTPWTESSTWNSLSGGIGPNDVEAVALADFAVRPNVSAAPAIFDVTAAVRAWVNGAPNYGWAVLPTTGLNWVAPSADDGSVSTRPRLEVTFAPSFLEFGSPTFGVLENAGTATITVTRRGAAASAVTVDYTTADATAVAGADYTAASGTLAWPAGDLTSRTFTVPITNDALLEGTETLSLQLSNPTGIAILTAASTAALAITPTPFDAWRLAKFGPNANAATIAENGDPDRDQVVNLLEYATGTDPLNAASAAPAQLVAGDYLTLAFQRVAAASDLTYTVQVSSNLQTWLDGSTYASTGIAPANARTIEVSRSGTTPESLVVRDLTAINGTPRRYMRLRVTRP